MRYAKTCLLLSFCLGLVSWGFSQHLVNQVQLSIDQGAQITIPGSLYNQGGEIHNAGLLGVSGDVTNSEGGKMTTTATSSLVFEGSSVQDLTGVDSLHALALEGGAQLRLGQPLVLTHALGLTEGKLFLAEHDLRLAAGASLTASGVQGYVVTNGSGRLLQAVGSSPVSFPVGLADAYLPVVLTNSGLSDELGVRLSENVLTDGTSGALIGERMVGLTWHLSEATPGNLDLQARFEWQGVDELPNLDPNNLQVYHYTGGSWVPEGSTGPRQGTDPSYHFTLGGITSLSPFAIGDPQSSFPVAWLAFTAELRDEGVQLAWATARETQSAHFVVERSAEQQHWHALETLPAAGQSDTRLDYRYLDRRPLAGVNYYRLRQVDLDGGFGLSELRQVTYQPAVRVYPNPATDWLELALPGGSWTVELYDSQGRLLRPQAPATDRLDLRDLPAGPYLLRLRSDDSRQWIGPVVKE